MTVKSGIRTGLPESSVASHRQSASHQVATEDLPLFRSSLEARRWQRERERSEFNSWREEITEGLYDLRKRLTAKLVGFDPMTRGLDALAERLDEKPSYTGTISRCLNRSEENRRYQIDWDAVILLDDHLKIELLHGIAALAGVEITVHEAIKIDPEEENRAAREVLRDLQRAGMNTAELVDRKLGVKPGTVKL